MSRSRACGALAIAALLTSCAVGPSYHTPDSPTPDRFAAESAGAAKPTAKSSADLAEWWLSLRDRELDSLVSRGLQSNLDLEAALTRLQEARTQEIVVTSAALPLGAVTGGGGVGTGTDLTNGRASSLFRSGENGRNLSAINESGGFEATWELDLFGKFQRQLEAAIFDAEALAEARDWTFVTVAADVARAYLDLRAQQRELAVLQSNIDVAKRTLDLVQTRFSRGLTNQLDVTLAQRQLATLQAGVAPLGAQIAASRNVIAVLLGQFPEDLAKELATPGPFPSLPKHVPAGLPVDLLRRRPDIRAAERLVAAATARIGAATADLFPSVILSGAIGGQGGRRSSSAVPITLIGSVGPAVYWPLLDFGALDAKIEIADLQSREAMLRYKQLILTAVQQVDDAIAAYEAEQTRLKELDQALAAARQAAMLSSERYDRGLTDFLNVLDAERQEYDLEESRVFAQQRAAEALVALYKALGGGWPTRELLPPVRQPDPALIAAARALSDRLAQPGQ